MKILEPINKNDEITVSYGPHFFGEGNQGCLCVHVDSHQVKVCSSRPTEVFRQRIILNSSSFRRRRQSFLRVKRSKISPKRNIEMRGFAANSSSGDNTSDDASSSEETSFSEDVQEPNLVSSPVRELNHVPPCFSPSTIPDRVDDSSSDENLDASAAASCTLSQENFVICVNEIAAQHGESDAAFADWPKFMQKAFPEYKLPSFKSIKQETTNKVAPILKTAASCGEGEVLTMDYVSDLLADLKNNMSAIIEYSNTRNPHKDIKIAPTFGESNVITIALAMNADGVRIINSQKRSLWPLWFSVHNLPPILRCKFVNIVLAKLWLGRGKHNWEIFFGQIKERFCQTSTFDWNNCSWQVNFEIKLLVVDLPAKAAILNMNQFNAYFGCTSCLIESKQIGDGKKGRYYPNERIKMRTPSQYKSYLYLMEEDGLESFRGIKGHCAVSDLLEDIPLTAPIDYMHQVLLGVTRALLFVVRSNTCRSGLVKISDCVSSIQLTSDLKRSLRSLDDLDFFKANELKVWLLYVGPVVFYASIEENLFKRFHLLSYAIRLLLLSSETCDLADELIKQFHFLTCEAYTDKVFSANIHSLNHLARQVKCYGPLWCTSAIMFESANYLLRCKFTGTVSHLKVLVERYIRNKNSCQMSPQRDRLYDLCRQFREKNVQATQSPST